MPCFRPGLTRHDKLNLSDSAIMWEEANNASCVINTDYKILWVVNSENYIYKRMALNRAKEVNILFNSNRQQINVFVTSAFEKWFNFSDEK